MAETLLVCWCCRDSYKESVSAGLTRSLPNLARKPRILVCAPSNAATDELLQRIMDHGFVDFQVLDCICFKEIDLALDSPESEAPVKMQCLLPSCIVIVLRLSLMSESNSQYGSCKHACRSAGCASPRLKTCFSVTSTSCLLLRF